MCAVVVCMCVLQCVYCVYSSDSFGVIVCLCASFVCIVVRVCVLVCVCLRVVGVACLSCAMCLLLSISRVCI